MRLLPGFTAIGYLLTIRLGRYITTAGFYTSNKRVGVIEDTVSNDAFNRLDKETRRGIYLINIFDPCARPGQVIQGVRVGR